jgi:hypothetical protein
MESSVISPHSCDACKDLVLELSGLDLENHNTVEEYEGQWNYLGGAMPYGLTEADVKRWAHAGCDLMKFLLPNITETEEPDPRPFEMAVHRRDRYFIMGISRHFNPMSTFEIYTTVENTSLCENPASRYLARPPNLTPASAQGFQIARDWLRECAENHEECHQWDENHKGFMPTRLLSIRPGLGQSVTFVSSSELKEIQPYTALSYCWGDH